MYNIFSLPQNYFFIFNLNFLKIFETELLLVRVNSAPKRPTGAITGLFFIDFNNHYIKISNIYVKFDYYRRTSQHPKPTAAPRGAVGRPISDYMSQNPSRQFSFPVWGDEETDDQSQRCKPAYLHIETVFGLLLNRTNAPSSTIQR